LDIFRNKKQETRNKSQQLIPPFLVAVWLQKSLPAYNVPPFPAHQQTNETVSTLILQNYRQLLPLEK
jgi:hypothetical protein